MVRREELPGYVDPARTAGDALGEWRRCSRANAESWAVGQTISDASAADTDPYGTNSSVVRPRDIRVHIGLRLLDEPVPRAELRHVAALEHLEYSGFQPGAIRPGSLVRSSLRCWRWSSDADMKKLVRS